MVAAAGRCAARSAIREYRAEYIVGAFFGFEKTRDFLPDALRRPVFGKTMFSLSYSSNYRQISNYTGSDNAGANWLAMETDSGDGYPGHFDNLVHTHGTTGLSDPDVLALLMAARLAKA